MNARQLIRLERGKYAVDLEALEKTNHHKILSYSLQYAINERDKQLQTINRNK